MPHQLHRGDLVEVLPASEILRTLDAEGSLDHLPFMPEMLESCGRRLRVLRRVEQVCTDGLLLPPGESLVRRFGGGAVVVLEGARCSGLSHAGCKRGCLIFWKEAWLRKAVQGLPTAASLPTDATLGREQLKCASPGGVHFCQSSEMIRTTRHLPWSQRVRNCFVNVLTGNYGPLEMLRNLAVWFYWRVHPRLFGIWPRGRLQTTPGESLGLQPGDPVEVKSLADIQATLDAHGKNRGLHFSADMAVHCGRRYQVYSRADKLIAEGVGKMRQLKNTVILEGVVCDSAYYAFGACPREDFMYWREIWLRRV